MAHLTCVCHSLPNSSELPQRSLDARASRTFWRSVALRRGRGTSRSASRIMRSSSARRLREGSETSRSECRHLPELNPEIAEQGKTIAARRPRSWRPADFGITQFFFDAGHYFDLVESLRAQGVDKPVIPGIMPASIASTKRMTELQGSDFPAWLAKLPAGRGRPGGGPRSGWRRRPSSREPSRRRRARLALLHPQPVAATRLII